MKNKLKIEGIDYIVNADGIPCCPKDDSLPMKRKEANRIYAVDFNHEICLPKMKWEWDNVARNLIVSATVIVRVQRHPVEE